MAGYMAGCVEVYAQVRIVQSGTGGYGQSPRITGFCLCYYTTGIVLLVCYYTTGFVLPVCYYTTGIVLLSR